MFRGRLISEANIQEYISNIVSKYLPADVPQWQMFVIPIAPLPFSAVASTSKASESSCIETQQHYYILVRIHHLLLEEESNLNIKDLLCLSEEQRSNVDVEENVSSTLLDMFEEPTYIFRLYNALNSCFINRWNEFRYCFDPSIQDNGKQTDSALQFLCVSFIICITVVQKFYKGFHAVQDNLLIRTKFFQTILKEECNKRNLSWDTFTKVMSPIAALRDLFHFWVWIGLTFALTFPYKVILETIAITQFIFNGTPTRRSTFFKFFYEYVPLLYGALKEFFWISHAIYSAPMLMFQELFERNKYCNIHTLQKVSLCGRKVLAWSDEINLQEIKAIERRMRSKINETELILYAITNSLTDFFTKLNKQKPLPQQVDVSFTCTDASHLRGNRDLNSQKNGMICLSLPLKHGSNSRLQLRAIKSSISKIPETQLPNYILSKYNRQSELFTNAIPPVWMRIFINYLSRKYPISLIQVTGAHTSEHGQELRTIWGDVVTDMLYFPPPQSNICK